MQTRSRYRASFNTLRDIALGQSEKALEETVKRAQEVLKNTPEKELEQFTRKARELDLFVRYLGCLGNTAVPTEIKSTAVFKWPLVENFTIEYPLLMRIQIEPRHPSNGYVILLATKQHSDALWRVTDMWLESERGSKVAQLEVPSPEVQQRANRELPRLVREDEQARDHGRLSAPCSGG